MIITFTSYQIIITNTLQTLPQDPALSSHSILTLYLSSFLRIDPDSQDRSIKGPQRTLSRFHVSDIVICSVGVRNVQIRHHSEIMMHYTDTLY